MALDYKLFFVYHGSMMALFMFSGLLHISIQVGLVAALACGLTVISIRHRKQNQWHWPGVGNKEILSAAISLALGLFFLGAITPRISPLNPRIFPWFAAGGGMTLFFFLSYLNISYPSKDRFLSHCGERASEPPQAEEGAPRELGWKRTIRIIFSIYFMAVWIVGVSFFWQYSIAIRDSSPEPTPARTEKIVDHGKTFYITPEQERIVSILKRSMTIGIPSAMFLGFLLHFIVGVKLFPNTPSLAEWRAKSDQPPN
jgi:hypothetical protein